jgi:hypothetical protein
MEQHNGKAGHTSQAVHYRIVLRAAMKHPVQACAPLDALAVVKP